MQSHGSDPCAGRTPRWPLPEDRSAKTPPSGHALWCTGSSQTPPDMCWDQGSPGRVNNKGQSWSIECFAYKTYLLDLVFKARFSILHVKCTGHTDCRSISFQNTSIENNTASRKYTGLIHLELLKDQLYIGCFRSAFHCLGRRYYSN